MAVSSGWRRAALRAGERWQKLGDDPGVSSSARRFAWPCSRSSRGIAPTRLLVVRRPAFAHELVQLRASHNFLTSLLLGGWSRCEVNGMRYATSTATTTASTFTFTAYATSNATIYRHYHDAVAQSGMRAVLARFRAVTAALELEPNNPADPNAIKVIAVRPADGQRFHVGYLPRETAAALGPGFAGVAPWSGDVAGRRVRPGLHPERRSCCSQITRMTRATQTSTGPSGMAAWCSARRSRELVRA